MFQTFIFIAMIWKSIFYQIIFHPINVRKSQKFNDYNRYVFIYTIFYFDFFYNFVITFWFYTYFYAGYLRRMLGVVVFWVSWIFWLGTIIAMFDDVGTQLE